MDNYGLAWVIVSVCAVIGGFGLYRLLRGAHTLLKWIVVVVAVIFFLTPAEIPNYPGYLAPAFVVLIFEAFFQTEGEPQNSLRVMSVAQFLGVLVTVGAYFVYARFVRKGSESGTGSNKKTAAAPSEAP